MSGFKQVFVTPLTDLAATGDVRDELGSIRLEGNKMYKYVVLKLAPTADVDIVAGDLLCYTDYANNEVGSDFADIEATNLGAGVAGIAVDMSEEKGFALWIQIKGPVTLSQTVLGSPAAGGDFQCHASTDIKGTKSVTLVQRLGTMLNTTTSVILDCPF